VPIWHAQDIMDTKQLKTFLTVVDTKNITRAAEILHLVQPAVSRHIKLLEEDLGVELFERARHGMVLTKNGQMLVDYARRSMLELERARAAIHGSQNGIGGLVTLGLLPSAVDVLAAPLLKEIGRNYPAIKVRFAVAYTGTLIQWMETGEIDCALIYGSERSSHIKLQPLVEEPLWVIGSPQFKKRLKKSIALNELAMHPMVLPSAPHGIRTLVDHACAVTNVQLNIVAEANALSAQRILVLNGMGLTILPPMAVTDDLNSGQLIGCPLTSPNISRSIALATPTNRPVEQHVAKSVEVLIECVHEIVASGGWIQGQWVMK
jgi:LysR family transcriptional regulator, nitrogen assimilation regulatory protein